MRAKKALKKLWRFKDLPEGLKLHLIKALVLQVLTYPPVPTHAFSKAALSRLQRVQNAALWYVYNTKWDDFVTSKELHNRASLPVLNIRLTELGQKVCQKMESEDWEQYLPPPGTPQTGP